MGVGAISARPVASAARAAGALRAMPSLLSVHVAARLRRRTPHNQSHR